MDREARCAAVHGVTESWTWLSYWTDLIDDLLCCTAETNTTLFSTEMFFQWVFTGEVVSNIINCSLAIDVGSSCSSVYYRSHIFKNLEKCIWSLQFCSYIYFGHFMFSGFILILHYSPMWGMGIIDEFIGLYIQLLQFSSVSHSVMSDSLQTHGLQHTRLPCPTPTPRVYSNSCSLSRWCYPTISSSVVSFFSYPQCFPAYGLFQWVSSSH